MIIKIIIFVVCALVIGSLFCMALQLGFLMGKQKFDPFKGKDPEEMTVAEIWDSMNEPQKFAMTYIQGQIIKNQHGLKIETIAENLSRDNILTPNELRAAMGVDIYKSKEEK